MRLRRNSVLAAALLTCVISQAARADAVDDYILARMKRYHVPGLALAVVRGGRVIKTKGYGVANLELNAPVSPNTVFEIGSMTKQFTASAIMLLVEQGKVNLDDRITKYFDGLPPEWGEITVRHLLTHTSGIRSYFGLPGFELSKHLTAEQFIKTVSVLKPNFAPGSDYLYSNTGFHLLGLIVEKASGKSYWEFLRENFFAPLGMTATTDRDPVKIVMNRASGYEWETDHFVNRDANLTDLFSAGALVSTVLDLAKWDAALYTERILKRKSLDEMWTPLKFSSGVSYPYGFGWGVENYRGHRLISHGGLTAGFSASIQRFVDDRLTIIILSNNGNYGTGSSAGRVARGVASLYIPSISLNAQRAIQDAEPQVTETLKGALVASLAESPDPNLFVKPAYDFHVSERGRALHRSIAAHGQLQSFTLIGRTQEGLNRIYLYRAVFGRDTIYLTFTLTGEGKISNMSVEEY